MIWKKLFLALFKRFKWKSGGGPFLLFSCSTEYDSIRLLLTQFASHLVQLFPLFSIMSPPRILLCGDVLGRLNQLFKRVQSVNKSAGPFDALFCVGQFFPDSAEQLEELTDYIEGGGGRSQIPLPTYFIGDYGVAAPKVLSTASRNSANLGFKMDGFKICDNLFWLRGSGKFTLHGMVG